MRFFGFCVRSVAVAAMVLAAGAASAKAPSALSSSAALASGSYSTLLATESVNVAGISSVGELGDAGNTVINLNVGANADITAIGWDVIVSAFDPSWLSEITVSFESSDQLAGVYLSVGNGDDNPGLNTAYSSGGLIDLVGLGLNFAVGADGILRMEFFEGFDDSSVSPDGLWNSGTLTIQTSAVPEPGTYGLMALGLLGVVGAARRRRVE